MLTRNDLLARSRSGLLELVRAGFPVDPRSLDDHEYCGTSLGLPRVIERLTWKKFKKVFWRDRVTGRLRGWNLRTRQNALSEPWIHATRDGSPVSYGHFDVVSTDGQRVPAGCDQGLLIDYGRRGAAGLTPMRWVRDPLVAVNEGDSRLLLGFSYLDVAGRLLHTPTFFCLERDVAVRQAPATTH